MPDGAGGVPAGRAHTRHAKPAGRPPECTRRPGGGQTGPGPRDRRPQPGRAHATSWSRSLSRAGRLVVASRTVDGRRIRGGPLAARNRTSRSRAAYRFPVAGRPARSPHRVAVLGRRGRRDFLPTDAWRPREMAGVLDPPAGRVLSGTRSCGKARSRRLPRPGRIEDQIRSLAANALAMTPYPAAFAWLSGPNGAGAQTQVQVQIRATLSRHHSGARQVDQRREVVRGEGALDIGDPGARRPVRARGAAH